MMVVHNSQILNKRLWSSFEIIARFFLIVTDIFSSQLIININIYTNRKQSKLISIVVIL